MKFLTFSVYNIEKLDAIAKAGDNLAKNLPEGYKILAMVPKRLSLEELFIKLTREGGEK